MPKIITPLTLSGKFAHNYPIIHTIIPRTTRFGNKKVGRFRRNALPDFM
jgi:hypothetical protein